MGTDALPKRPGLTVVDLEKRFGSVTAVQDLSLAVEDGELLAIVGPSGCGKTTLLRIIAGLERPDQGRVFIQGKDVTPLPPERRDVGFVFQQFALFPNMTVAANVEYGLKRKRVPAPERAHRVAEMLSMVGLHGLEHRRPDQLSAGQQQRVALARALAPRPNTLLLDEPLSALDAAIRERLREELRQTQRRLGITTILVTHDQEEAMAIADRVAVMNDGRLEQVGTPWELYHQPRTRFVAGFIGRGNFLHGRMDDEGIVFSGLGRVPMDMVGKLLEQSPADSAEAADGRAPADGAVAAGGPVPADGAGAAGGHGVADGVEPADGPGPADGPVPADGAGAAGAPVLAGGPEPAVGARPAGGLGLADGLITALVRPESVIIEPSGVGIAQPGRQPGALAFEATIIDVTFGGERSTVRLAVDGVRGGTNARTFDNFAGDAHGTSDVDNRDDCTEGTAGATAQGVAWGTAEGVAGGTAEGVAWGTAEGVAGGTAEGVAGGTAEGVSWGIAQCGAEDLAQGTNEQRMDPTAAARELIAAVVSEEARRLAQKVGERVSVSIPWAALRLLAAD